MSSKLQSLWLNLKTFVLSIRHWPIVEPVLDLLGKERVVTLIMGWVSFSLVPRIQGISPDFADKLGWLIFFGTLGLFFGLQREVWMETKASLPTTPEGYLEALFSEILKGIADIASRVGGVSVPASNATTTTTTTVSPSTPTTVLPLVEVIPETG
jgi:hypothetical protein